MQIAPPLEDLLRLLRIDDCRSWSLHCTSKAAEASIKAEIPEVMHFYAIWHLNPPKPEPPD